MCINVELFQVMSTIDDLLEWFEEAEGKLMSAQPISCEPHKLQSQLSEQKVSKYFVLLTLSPLVATFVVC